VAFGIDEGPSGQENSAYNNIFGTSQFAANEGQQDVTSSDAFMNAILSGDPTKIGQFLGPQIKAIQGQAQQKKQTNAQFGNRGGGTNAQNQTIGDQTTSGINNLISSLTGTALSGLSSTGQNLLGQGMQGFQSAFGDAAQMQTQRANQWNDIFNSAASVAAAPFTGGASLGYGGFSMPGGGGSTPGVMGWGGTASDPSGLFGSP
jgi:hypothetical protein